MNRCATGLSVRSCRVPIPTGPGCDINLTGNTLMENCLPPKRSTERGNIVRKLPVASSALNICMESQAATRFGTSRPPARKALSKSARAGVSGRGKTHGSLINSASPILRRLIHRLAVPATTLCGSSMRFRSPPACLVQPGSNPLTVSIISPRMCNARSRNEFHKTAEWNSVACSEPAPRTGCVVVCGFGESKRPRYEFALGALRSAMGGYWRKQKARRR